MSAVQVGLQAGKGLLKYGAPVLRGAARGVSGLLRGGASLGKNVLLGTGAYKAGKAIGGLGSGDNDSPEATPLSFGQVVRSNVAAANDPMSVVPSSLAQAPVANNSGKNTSVNANTLQSSTENLQDIENVLVDIRQEVKKLVRNSDAVKNAPVKPSEKTEEQIKAGFQPSGILGNSTVKSGMKGAGMGLGALAALFGLGVYSDSENSDSSLAPRDPKDGPLDLMNSTRAVASTGNAAGKIAKVAAAPTARAGRAALTAAEDIVTNPKASKGLTRAGQAVATTSSKVSALASKAAQVPGKAATKVLGPEIAQAIGKVLAKKGPGLVARAVPFLGTIAGGVMGIAKLVQGDMIGAGLAATALVPGFGTAGTLGIAGYEIAREAYAEIYDGQYPESDPLSNERWPELLEIASEQVEAYMKENATEEEAERVQAENLQSAVDSGLYTDRNIWADTVDESKIADAKTEELQAILAKDDISQKNKGLITAELESRSAVTSASPEQAQPRVDSNQVSTAMEEEESTRQSNSQPIVIDNSTNTGGSQATPTVEAPVVNVTIGNTMMTPAQGSARFVSDALYA